MRKETRGPVLLGCNVTERYVWRVLVIT